MKIALRFLCLTGMFWLLTACSERESAPEEMAAPEMAPAPEAAVTEPAEAPPTAPGVSDAILAAIQSPDRPASDKARDNDRRPDLVLQFFGVKPGMTVVEYIAAGGYYTELLSRVVGENGHVYATRLAEERIAGGRLPNVTPIESGDMGVAPGGADLAFTALNYHDLVNQGTPREPWLALIMQQLRVGGTFAVIDHAAEDGSGSRDVGTLHRIDEQVVKDEVEGAGFVLVAESDILRHPEDDRTQKVFTPGLRGKTDRFVLMYRKPQPQGDPSWN